jgi:tetratricopeptide (TPR) repeat protein
MDKHQYEEIKEILEVIKRKEREAEYWYYKAVYYTNTGKEKKAIKELGKAIRENKAMKEEAKKEEKFAKIREKEEFKEIVK